MTPITGKIAEAPAPTPLVYTAFRFGFRAIAHLFFREIQTTGAHLVPASDPCIFIVGPHANQFIDGVTLLSLNPRHSYVLMASSSYHRPLIGHVGKILSAIPVVRPQDIVQPGQGVLVYDPIENPLVLRGIGTQFTYEIGPRDFVHFGLNCKGHVARVVSDTCLELSHAVPHAEKGTYASFRIGPHVDQSGVFREVQDAIFGHECVTVFPEGGSHDRSEMLPLKAGFAIMALGALAENPDLPLKIVPVGLNYFHPDRFRSRAVVSFGQPLEVDPADVEKYRQGDSKARREAVTHILDQSDAAFRAVTVNAPDYDTLRVIQATRRLYASSHTRSHIDETVQLNRNFVSGWTRLKLTDTTGEMDALMRKVRLYNDTLSFFGIRDHQVDILDITPVRAAALLFQRLCKLAVLVGLGAPAFLLNLPLIWATNYISKKKQREALAGSVVKITGKDVLATWKIIVAGVAAPLLYGLYALGYLNHMVKHRPTLSMTQKLARACLSWAAQPILYYVLLLRMGDIGLDVYKSIKPLFLAVRNPEVSQLLKIMRKDLSKDVTAFVHKHSAVFLL